MAEVAQLLEQEIPEGRQHLQESFNNLENVAKYCRENYITATNKKQALEETKNYTTHSLASVAYQINNLATNFLKLLDLQQSQTMEMESSVNYLAQTVNIHKEKVARREIGVLTTNRNTNRPLGVKNGIIFPEQAERPTKYQRKPIDYTVLDEIGHGVKVQEQGIIKTTTSVQRDKTSRSSSISSNTSHPSIPPNTRPPTPPQGRGTIGKSAGAHQSQYRTPAPPIAPPSIPATASPYAPGGMAMQNQSRQSGYVPGDQVRQSGYGPADQSRQSGYGPGDMRQSSNYGPTEAQMNILAPPVGLARPMSQDAPPPSYPGMHGRVSHLVQQPSTDLPPPPPSMSEAQDSSYVEDNEVNSPPLPPPPTDSPSVYNQAPPPPPEFNDPPEDIDDHPLPPQEEDPYAATGPNLGLGQPDWKPANYIEKVIAIYDYLADKEDELTFNENAVIYVTNKNDDGWWEGVLNGFTGLFPGNYVEPCM
ncbi:abl interactor 2-like isoform X1 [Pecten maximus]|uniref:abl interactor 2-like isoform X1 n=1 Tax=Pecten maximus TaxID=6579 RepID=UPI001457F56D|nr:abl interactor 2-like isoform X1 [Pecten maximus]